MLTMGRMSEINRLKWDVVDLIKRKVVLYTRKKRGGKVFDLLIIGTGDIVVGDKPVVIQSVS